jgi:putative FmdB family regulatory protein
MPLYDYQCRACGHRFEALVRAGSDAPTCPSCRSADLERLLSMFAVSSETTRQANFEAARAKHNRSQKDKNVAEAEEVRRHAEEHP